jgi:MFS family permease
MTSVRRRPFGQNYAFVVMGVIFVALLVAAGMRSATGVLIVPLEAGLGWSRDSTSAAAATGILLYGLVGPFAGALFQSFGVRRTLLCALTLMAFATLLASFSTKPWQFMVTWGVLSGMATGCVSLVLGATVANRWFVSHRGLVMGLLTASTATGTLLFLTPLAALAEHVGWRAVVLTVSIAAAVLVPFVWLLLPERPADAGLLPYGATADTKLPPPPVVANPVKRAFAILWMAMHKPTFWLLFGTFFVCGFTTNGLVGTHLIALCADHGIAEVSAAGLLSMMGLFDLLGTTGSGWLTDRFDARKLLFMYYGLRGLSLIYLPFSDFSFYGLSIFAVFYGLDWIATVPPTVRIATDAFGDRDAPVVFGWIAAGHQMGAASAALFAGVMRVAEGRYLEAFVIAGMTGIAAALMSLAIRRQHQPVVALGSAAS